MKTLLLSTFILLNPLFLIGQQYEHRIDSLQNVANGISEHIDHLNLELDSINEKIKVLKFEMQQKEEAKLANKGIKTAAISNVKLRKGPSPLEDNITTIPANDTVFIHGIESNYYKVSYNGIYGWSHKDFFKDVPELIELKQKRKISTNYSLKTSSTSSSTKSNKNYKLKNKSGTWVKGHYRRQNGKKVWVRGHYRKY